MELERKLKQIAASLFLGMLLWMQNSVALPTELIFRPQTAEEAFSLISYLVKRLPWYQENGYHLVLPTHPQFELWYQKGDVDKEELKNIFSTQIYDPQSFDACLAKLYDSQDAIHKGLAKLSILAQNWGFGLKEKYTIVLTLYGIGGRYNPSTATVMLLTAECHKRHVAETVLHEIVHIGIEETIVKKYRLSHWEKERLVDLICMHCLAEILPEYRLQPKGDPRLDAFADPGSIFNDLPSAIALYVEKHIRQESINPL